MSRIDERGNLTAEEVSIIFDTKEHGTTHPAETMQADSE